MRLAIMHQVEQPNLRPPLMQNQRHKQRQRKISQHNAEMSIIKVFWKKGLDEKDDRKVLPKISSQKAYLFYLDFLSYQN